METEEFSVTQTISELDKLREIVKGSDLEHTQLTPGRFRGQTTRINLGASVLDIGEYHQAIRARGSIGSEFKTFFFMPQQEGHSNGFPVNRDSFVAFGSGATADAYGGPNPKWMTLTIKHDEWLKYCRDLGNWAARLDEPRAFSVAPSPLFSTGLVQTLRSVADLADTTPSRFNHASLRELIHHDLMSRIKHCLATTNSTRKEQSKITRHHRYRIVKQAEAYVSAHLDCSISVAQICENVGVSERTLHYAFRDVWDISPYDYLIKLRLNRARQKLGRAMPGQTTITTVAMECGFWHLGRFSGAYKALFGELPSYTLNRRGDQ